MLLQFSFAALFFDLSPQIEDLPLFWVGVLSVLCALPPLLLFALFLRPNYALYKKVNLTESFDQLNSVLKEARRTILCRIVVGMALFVVISILDCVYLVAFSHSTSPSMTRDWLSTCFVSIVID